MISIAPCVRRWLCLGACFLSQPLFAQSPVTLDVDQALRPLIEKHLSVLRDGMVAESPSPREQQAIVQRARGEIIDLLATEGYFSPTVTRAGQGLPIQLKIDAGPRTRIESVAVSFEGTISEEPYAERRRRIEAEWPYKAGQPFRQADWDAAKAWLLEQVGEKDFPAVRFAKTEARVNPETRQATLSVVVDSGPAYTMGALRIDGLEEYDEKLVRRFNDIEPGDPYDRPRLLELQRALQATPYFASVVVDMPTDGPTERAPIDVVLVEGKPKKLTFGAGVSSNNGYRAQVGYRDADFLGRGWQLSTGIQLEQKHQLFFSDVYLPPSREGHQDSFGGQIERSRSQGLTIQNAAVGVARKVQRGNIETHLAFKLQREIYSPDGAERERNKALTVNWTWTWRQIDDLFNPRDGFVVSTQIGGGAKAAFSDQNFLRLFGRAAWYRPVGDRDVLLLRAEGGATLAPSREGIPQDFLFRTGGAQSVRGYQYNSLGVTEGDATVGGRYMALLSGEYTRWWENNWGAALFWDAGNAMDDRESFRLYNGYGVGARWRSPAGPIALDLGYGEEERRVRLHFSIAVAF